MRLALVAIISLVGATLLTSIGFEYENQLGFIACAFGAMALSLGAALDKKRTNTTRRCWGFLAFLLFLAGLSAAIELPEVRNNQENRERRMRKTFEAVSKQVGTMSSKQPDKGENK